MNYNMKGNKINNLEDIAVGKKLSEGNVEETVIWNAEDGIETVIKIKNSSDNNIYRRAMYDLLTEKESHYLNKDRVEDISKEEYLESINRIKKTN